MIRNLRVLGVAMAAVFALSAVVASGASAQQGKLTVNGGSEVTTDATENGLNAFTVFGAKIECPGSTAKGHKITQTPHVPIPANATELTITPNFVNCVAVDGLGTHRATVTMTSCDFHVKIGQTTGGVANTYGLNYGITCTVPTDTIHIDVYAFAGSELGGIQCSITPTSEQDLTGAHITTNTVNDDFNVSGTIQNLHVVRHGSACNSETTSNTGEQHINATVKGTSAGGANTGITVTDS